MDPGRILRGARRWLTLPPGRQRRALFPRAVAWLERLKWYERSRDNERQQAKHATCVHEFEEFFPGMWKCKHGCGVWESRPL